VRVSGRRDHPQDFPDGCRRPGQKCDRQKYCKSQKCTSKNVLKILHFALNSLLYTDVSDFCLCVDPVTETDLACEAAVQVIFFFSSEKVNVRVHLCCKFTTY
jgi:hypothetical protein